MCLRDYEVVLLVDIRERFRFAAGARPANLDDGGSGGESGKSALLATMMARAGMRCEKAMLPVGDMLWVAEHRATKRRFVLDCVVERKRVGDLADSIRDNRYREQRMRLARSGLRRIVYVIEGRVALDAPPAAAMGGGGGGAGAAVGADGVVDAAALRTAMASLETVFGFALVNTASLSSTIDFLAGVHAEMVQWYSRVDVDLPVMGADADGEGEPFERFAERLAPGADLTLAALYGRMLRQLRGCSVDVVLAILRSFPTLAHLLRAVERVGPAGAVGMLAALPCGPGKTVGATVASKLHQWLTAAQYPNSVEDA